MVDRTRKIRPRRQVTVRNGEVVRDPPSLTELQRRLMVTVSQYVRELRTEYQHTRYASEIDSIEYYAPTVIHSSLEVVEKAMIRGRITDPWEKESVQFPEKHAEALARINGVNDIEAGRE